MHVVSLCPPEVPVVREGVPFYRQVAGGAFPVAGGLEHVRAPLLPHGAVSLAQKKAYEGCVQQKSRCPLISALRSFVGLHPRSRHTRPSAPPPAAPVVLARERFERLLFFPLPMVRPREGGRGWAIQGPSIMVTATGETTA